MKRIRFNWDIHNVLKCQKHGVDVETIEAFLRGKVTVEIDLSHCQSEIRYLARGLYADRFLVVIFTIRIIDGHECLRPISARFGHLKERSRFDEKSKKGKGSEDGN